MLQDLEVFVSRHDVESGTRWASELASQLSASPVGILCLTAENQTAPWMLFEAGALNNVADGRVCGLLLNGLTPANIAGPLAQFQHRRMDEDDFFLLLRDVNERMDGPLPDASLRMVFAKWWPDLASAYAAACKARPASPPAAARRSDRELLEEVLERMRASQQGPGSQMFESNDTLNAAKALLRVVQARSSEEVAFLQRIHLFKTTRDYEAVESYADNHPKVVETLQNAGLVWRNKQGRLVMNRFLGECVLPLLGDSSAP